MIAFVKRIARDDAGATAVEYGLILALIFLAILGAVRTVGQDTIKMWNETSTTVVAASERR